MSTKNIEIAKKFCTTFETEDLDVENNGVAKVLALFDEDVDWEIQDPAAIPNLGSYRGRAATRSFKKSVPASKLSPALPELASIIGLYRTATVCLLDYKSN